MTDKRFEIVSTAFDKKGKQIAVGRNHYNKSNPFQKELSILAGMSDKRIYLHSEVDALIRARNLNKKVHTLKIERYDSQGNPKISFPCPSCQIAIKLAGVQRVIFTCETGFKEWIV